MSAYRWALAAMMLPIAAMLAYGMAVRSRAVVLIGAGLLAAAALLALALYFWAQAGPPPIGIWGGPI
ncbi:MAG: hypothetical protein GX558_07505 [Clostridiales bacterium]|nr:hypothetical protein [Clostridiales bacterium]